MAISLLPWIRIVKGRMLKNIEYCKSAIIANCSNKHLDYLLATVNRSTTFSTAGTIFRN
jgi:hypothetical protein